VERDQLSLQIYDPNWPDRDDVDVRVRLGPAGTTGGQVVELGQSTGEPLLGFFAAPFRPARR
jgi:hypothetical protein